MSEIGIYQQTILEHSKNPLNFKSLKTCTHQANGNNPLCGDNVEIFTNIKNDINDEICFQGAGCAISIASASILTKVLNKKSVQDSKNILENFIKMVENKAFNFDLLNNEEKTLLMTFSELQKFPMRSKCATMSWSTFNAALNHDNYNTEVKV